jgi:hypothetical protein
LKKRIVDGQVQYKLKWKGYPITNATWENVVNTFEQLENRKIARKRRMELYNRILELDNNSKNKFFSDLLLCRHMADIQKC